MFRLLLALGIILTSISLLCVGVTTAQGPHAASFLALIASLMVIMVALTAPWILTRVLKLTLKYQGLERVRTARATVASRPAEGFSSPVGATGGARRSR